MFYKWLIFYLKMSKRKQQSLFNYFNSGETISKRHEADVSCSSNGYEKSIGIHPEPETRTGGLQEQPINVQEQSATVSSEPINGSTQMEIETGPFEKWDISNYVNLKVSEEEKVDILGKIWMPTAKYEFPSTSFGNEKVKRKFRYTFLLEYPWLTYSKIQDGVFCKYCVLFSQEYVGKSNSQQLGQLVNQPFRFWRKTTEKLREHQSKKYHAHSLLTAENLKSIAEGHTKSVIDIIDTASLQQAKENRKKLIPIIKTVLFCGRNGLALRGHRDCGQISETDENMEDKSHEGNFRQLLKFRIDAGDEVLKEHLKSCANNASYISPRIQNEIIHACNEIILKKIIEKVNASECFSIIADETTDISLTEQVSLCVRFVEIAENKCTLVENFLQFVPVISTRGVDLANTILTTLGSLGLNLDFIRGQGYDGAAAMSGTFNGVQAKIREKFPSAIYVHCASHSLNLAISDACQIKDVRNCIGIIEKCYSFMNTPKRNSVFQENIAELCPSSRKEALKKLSPTRWIERHEAIMVMVELLHPLTRTLETIGEWKDKESSAGASILLNSLQNSNFIITLFSMEKIFSLTLPLSRILQSKEIDLGSAVELCDVIIEELETIRIDSVTVFNNIFEKAENILKVIIDEDFKIELPRIAKKQTHRFNIQTDSANCYYRISIFNQFLDSAISHIKERLSKHKIVLKALTMFITPNHHINSSEDERKIEVLKEIYSNDLSNCSVSMLTAEYQLWKRKLHGIKMSAIEALQECNAEIFPNVHKLLKILVTLPVTTCTAERSFSTMKYLKNYLRNSTSETRLNGLCLLYIYKNIPVTENEVLNILQKQKRRININL